MSTTPRLLTDLELHTLLLDVSYGAPLAWAAQHAGCTLDDVEYHRSQDPDFHRSTNMKMFDLEIRALANINHACEDPKFWRASAWALAVKHPDQFDLQFIKQQEKAAQRQHHPPERDWDRWPEFEEDTEEEELDDTDNSSKDSTAQPDETEQSNTAQPIEPEQMSELAQSPTEPESSSQPPAEPAPQNAAPTPAPLAEDPPPILVSHHQPHYDQDQYSYGRIFKPPAGIDPHSDEWYSQLQIQPEATLARQRLDKKRAEQARLGQLDELRASQERERQIREHFERIRRPARVG